MSTYNIIPARDGIGFEVAIVSTNGTRQTMLGFRTEAEARQWIEQSKRLDTDVESDDDGSG